jgi:CHASE2 domain-containing sensor protein
VCGRCWDDSVPACPEHEGVALETVFDGARLIDKTYELDRRLGSGGMGVVYRARHIGLERSVAVKLIGSPHFPHAAGGSFGERFRVEARALGKLKHPAIVGVTDYGVDPRGGGLPYLVMECLEGATLQELCARAGALPLEQAITLLEPIARGVDHAHAQGVLHGDLKPGNIFLCREPAATPEAAVKILDFGLARLVAPDGTASVSGEPGSFPGTPAYGAPELATCASPQSASDLYSLGVLAYEMLVGVLPFTGSAAELRSAHQAAAPPPPSTRRPSLPRELDAPLLAALEKDPSRRPRHAIDIVQGIRRAWREAERRQWRARERPRRLVLSAVLAVGLAALALLAASWGPVDELERRTVDARFARQSPRAPDDRIVVVAMDEASLAADPTPLSGRADEFGRLLDAVFEAGAEGIALDFLLPRTWSHSEVFSRFVLSRADRLALAAFSTPAGDTIGVECVHGLTAATLGPARTAALFGFVNLDEDRDGIIRQARLAYPAGDGGRRDSLATRAARTLVDVGPSASGDGRFWIDHSVDWSRVRRLSWQDLPHTLAREPALFRGRLVLVGGSFVGSGDDYHRVPRRGGKAQGVSGIVVQALIVSSLLAGLPIREAATGASFLLAAAECVALLMAALCVRNTWLTAGLLVGIGAVHVFVAFVVFQQAQVLVPVIAPLAVLLLASWIGLLIRSALVPFPR